MADYEDREHDEPAPPSLDGDEAEEGRALFGLAERTQARETNVPWRTDGAHIQAQYEMTTELRLRLMSMEKEGALILVVHDVEETRDGIEKLLKVDGYRVDPVREEEDAVARATRQPPDLMLVSLGGAPTHVIATACRIRDRAALGNKVPIVIFCVESLAEGGEINIGGDVYLTRPDNFNQLRALIEQLLRSAPVKPQDAIAAPSRRSDSVLTIR